MELKEISTELCILVFRTNINTDQKVKLVRHELMKINGVYRVNVDLDDWEKVLRVECDPTIRVEQIENRIGQLGFECTELTT